MRHVLRPLLTLLLLPLLVVALLWLAVNTDPGRRVLAWSLAELSNGQVVVSGLSGTLPTAPRIARLELRDAAGAWLVVEGAVLDLELLPLLRGTIAIAALTARSVVLHRVPVGDETAAVGIELPVQVLLGHLAIDRLDLDGAVPGAPALTITGSGSVATATHLQARVLITAPGRMDSYRLDLARGAESDRLDVAFQEAPGGLVAALAAAAGVRLPAVLDGWRLDASAVGPRTALDLNAVLAAGPLQATAAGLLDLESQSAAGLRVSAEVPALTLALAGLPAIAWQRLSVRADLDGSLRAPRGTARVEWDGPAAGDLSFERLIATAEGDAARLGFALEVRGLHTPAALPEALATVPLRLTGELSLNDPALPVQLAVNHPLIDLSAAGGLTARAGHATLSLPDLAAFSGLTGTAVAGSARFDLNGAADGAPRLDATGELALTQAPAPIAGLLGPAARLALSVRGEGAAWQIAAARIAGARLQASAQGRVAGDALALDWTLDLTDLSVLAPGWSGRMQVRGELSGAPRAPLLVADLTAQAGFQGVGTERLAGQVTGRLSARPALPEGSLALRGDWAGQPVRIDLQAERAADGSLNLALGDGRWASVAAAGTLRLPRGATLPQGELRLRVERLADLAPLLPPEAAAGLAGRLSASLTLTPTGAALIEAAGEGLMLPGAVGVQTLALTAQVTEPLGQARTEATLRLRGLALGTVGGEASLSIRGPAAALDLTADARLADPGGPLRLAAGARLDAPARRLALQRLEGQARGETLRLLAPAMFDLSDGLRVDRLRLGLRTGSIEVAGRLAPRLDLRATVAGLPLELVQLAAPKVPLTGTLGADLQLTGTLDAPVGALRAQASGLRLTTGPGRGIPPAQLKVAADLAADGVQLDVRATTGPRTDLRVHGRVAGRLPFALGTLALRADGRVDLALFDPLLTSGGRQLSGQAVLATAITGTVAAPRLDGTLRLTDAALWDRTIGLALTGIQGRLRLDGDTVRLERLTAQTAGQSGTGVGRGTVELTGSVGVLAPGLPVDLRLIARNALPIQLDQLDVQGDADLRLSGRAAERLNAVGTVRFTRIEVRLPERLPAEVAILEVRERGGSGRPVAAARPSTFAPDLGLDLLLAAPRAVYVSGRGVDAELGGEVRLRGTLADPVISGGFELRRGSYELAGQTLKFSRGRIGFDGAHGIDPTLDLEARASAAGSTAILAVVGTAKQPRIELRGEPPLPQDEVLSRLLFGVAGGRLSPVQAVQLGTAAASLAGVELGGGLLGLGILDRVRSGLGLERLRLGTDDRGDSSLEGGRQLTERVYLGARQGVRAGETQGVLRIEVTPRIRVEADVGASGGTRAGAAFEHEY
jgi:translocation and assembly module TamB